MERQDRDSLACTRCSAPIEPFAHYCLHCGAPVGAWTTYLPFESIRAYGESMVRMFRISARPRPSVSWPGRLLGLLTVLLSFPPLILLLPSEILRGRGSET